MNEQEQFLKDLDNGSEKVDVLEASLDGKVDDKVIDDNPELAPDSIKDRRHKRLEEKLQAERESNIQLSARLETLSEVSKFAKETTGSEYLKSVEKIYGTDSPEATAATELLKGALKGVEDRATERALEIFRKEQKEASDAVKKEEQQLNTMLEELEDDYNVDLTSTSAQSTKKGFLTLLERMSPKDSDGNIIHYADHHAVFDQYKSQIKKVTDTRAKDLSSRSMVNSGSSSDNKKVDDATQKFLKQEGII